MTVRDIARLCGVSPATVSRVINGNAPVNEETRRSIETAIQEHGFSPRARKHAVRRHGSIGVLLPSIRHTYFQCVLDEINTRLAGQGLRTVILPDDDPARTLGLLEQIPLDGVILLHEEIEEETLEGLGKRSLAMVMCGALALKRRFSAVHVDDLAAAYDGTNYLLELGHREIGLISDWPHSISSGFQRVAGSRKAMEDAGLKLPEERVCCLGTHYEAGYEGAQKLMETAPGLTAIFAHSDASALGALAALADMGLRVPQDVSVLGFDDTGEGERSRPRLTCIHQPIGEIAAKSIERLLEEISQPGSVPQSITLPHSLTVRESCAAPPG